MTNSIFFHLLLQQFPLNQELVNLQFKDSYQIPSEFRIKSDMMREMEAIEPEIFQIGKPDDEDEDKLRERLTRAEIIERSRELRRLRMRESQQSAKAHRQNKIKSKKYHRILKKEKMREQIKEFELLQKTDPEAALRKIEQLDKNRVEERANLRHRNTGTWAKNLQVRAKYNKEVRKELADQITISRELTAKKPIDESDDEDEANNNGDNPESDPNYDPFNPWLKTTEQENPNSEVQEFLGNYRKYWADRNVNAEKLKEHLNGDASHTLIETNGEKFAELTTNTEKKKSKQQNSIIKPKREKQINPGWMEEDIEDDLKPKTNNNNNVSKKRKPSKIVDNLDDLFDEAEDTLNAKFAKKAKRLQSSLDSSKNGKQSKQKKAKIDKTDEIDLSFKKQIKRPKIDEALNIEGDGEKNEMDAVIKTASAKLDVTKNQSNSNDTSENINPDAFSKIKPKHLQTAIPDTVYTNDDDGFYENDDDEHDSSEARRLTLAEAFEDDDIVAQFQRDKEEVAKKNGPQEIDLSLPGWGSWGGSGIDPTKQKAKRRLVLKFPAAEQRKPENKGNVVIIENGDEKLKKHRVADLPFPFTSVADYEQSIRAPLGSDFVPATAHKLLTKPAVTTKLGTIIKPMNENLIIKPVRRSFTKTGNKIFKLGTSF